MSSVALQKQRNAQTDWQSRSVPDRIKVLRRTRQLIALRAEQAMASVSASGRREAAETLPLEVIPLLEAIRFLERKAVELLHPRRLGRKGRPLWLWGIESTVQREPFGVVLIIAPFNYPLFLPGVQALQALVAGNAVQVKPAPNCTAPMTLLAACLAEAGLPVDLFVVLEESVHAAEAAIDSGIDLIVLTGSGDAGRAVLHRAAQRLLPAIVELSGNDAAFVLPGADVGIVTQALAYGLRLNGGATCIAPRRVFVPKEMLPAIETGILHRLLGDDSFPVLPASRTHVNALLQDARDKGARIAGGAVNDTGMNPALVIAPPPDARIMTEDFFAPILSLIPVDSPDQALLMSTMSPHGLGASVFGPVAEAEVFAARVDAGSVVVNDLIVPTADPRLPFEGRRNSGFGPTRGAEGLLAMTRTRAATARHNRLYPHFRSVRQKDASLFLAYIALAHGDERIKKLPCRLARLGISLLRRR